MKNSVIALLLLFFVISLCQCRTGSTLSKSAKAWIPYTGNETLVFESNDAKRDSIFLLGPESGISRGEQYIIQHDYEWLGIKARQANLSVYDTTVAPEQQRRDNIMYTIIDLNSEGGDNISFDLVTLGARFYELPHFALSELEDRKPETLSTVYDDYDDVYILESTKGAEAAYSRFDNYVERIYWSKSQGLVRYDKKNNEYWVLKRKYETQKKRDEED